MRLSHIDSRDIDPGYDGSRSHYPYPEPLAILHGEAQKERLLVGTGIGLYLMFTVILAFWVVRKMSQNQRRPARNSLLSNNPNPATVEQKDLKTINTAGPPGPRLR